MQTSKKILLTVTGILLALLVSSLMVMRQDTLAVYKAAELSNPLTAVPVDQFKSVIVKGKWDVQMRQGRVQQVEVSFDPESKYLPKVSVSNDTLYLSVGGDSTATITGKIITPYLKSLSTIDARVQLKKFALDTISIKLQDSYLINEENKFVYVNYHTLGDSKIEFIDDPFQ